MHILITADAMGGVWTYTRELASGLTKLGAKITLVSFGEIPAPDQTAWVHELGIDYRPTAFKLEWMQDCEADLEDSARFLQAVIDEVHPDLLHLNQFYYGALETAQPKIVVAHSDVVSWFQEVHGGGPKDARWGFWYRDMVVRGLSGANAVVAPTRWMLETVKELFVTPKLGSVIYNGRTPSLFNPHVSKERYAASAGRIWDFGKNAALLTKIDPPYVIHLAGCDESPNQGEERQPFFGEGKKVAYRGVLNEKQIQQLFSRAEVYVATSQYEPFGLAPLEAALSRCALVLSDIPTFRELWGDSAVYFERNNPESLQAALTQMYRDHELRATYAKLAYDRATRRYTAQRMSEEYFEVYKTLIHAGAVAA